MLVFVEGGTRREPTTNSTQIWQQAEFALASHWWEAGALTTAPSMLSNSESRPVTFTSRLFKKTSFTRRIKERKNVEGKKNQATAENVNFISQTQERP